MEQSLRETEGRLVGLAATDLPLALVPDLLAAVQRQAAGRTRGRGNGSDRPLAGRAGCGVVGAAPEETGRRESTITLVTEFLEADRANRPQAQTQESRLRLSDAARQLLEHLVQRGRDERQAEAQEQLEQLEKVRRTPGGYRTQPGRHARRGDDRDRGGTAQDGLGGTGRIRRRRSPAWKRSWRGCAAERDEIEKQLAKRRRKIVDEELRSEEDTRLARLLVRTQATMQDYLRRATQRKIDRLSQLVTESFRYLLRKQTLVERVLIDPDSFAITLYDDTGRAIPKQRLSEGEKQIFAVSVLWGLSRAAARPLPAIIDTPMARLDGKHRDKLVERYFPHASHQVIVLSTDTEIERHYFHDLQPHIARAYHLNYDDQRKLTVAEEGYFWEPAEEAGGTK